MPTDALYSAFSNLDFTRYSEWGVDELRTYVEYLEFENVNLLIRLCETKAALIRQRNKASRRKSPPEQYPKDWPPNGLLKGLLNPRTKRGRKKRDDLKSLRFAKLALQKRAELEAAGKRVTNTQALKAVCDDRNLLKAVCDVTDLSKRDIREITKKRHIINLMSKLRKSF